MNTAQNNDGWPVYVWYTFNPYRNKKEKYINIIIQIILLSVERNVILVYLAVTAE